MTHRSLLKIAVAACAISVTGCIDNDYDLSDIDTNVQFAVDNLTVPINIDQISLKSIISTNDMQVIDGVYTYTREGDFTMASISIPKVVVPGHTSAAINLSLPMPTLPPNEGVIENHPLDIDLPQQYTNYSYHTDNISHDLLALYHAECSGDIAITLEIKGMPLKARYTFTILR